MKARNKIFGFIGTMILSAMLSTAVMAAPVASPDYKFLLNGGLVQFTSENAPIIEDGRTLFQLTTIFDLLNQDGTATKDWNSESKMVTLSRGKTTVKLWIGSQEAEVNGEKVMIDGAAPMIYKDRTYVPLRFLASAFDMTVSWDQNLGVASAIDNTDYAKIKELFKIYADRISGSETTKLDMSVGVDASIQSSVGNIPIQMAMKGTYEQDFSKGFVHSVLDTTSTVLGAKSTSVIESYKNGNELYTINRDTVLKATAKDGEEYGYSLEGSVGNQDFTTYGLSRDSKGNYVASTVFFLQGSAMQDLIGMSVDDLAGGTSVDSMEMTKPIVVKYVFDQTTGDMISFSIDFAMTLQVTIAGEAVTMDMDCKVDVSNLQFGAVIDTVVPQSVISKAK